jgi:hypothetical protein
MRERLALCAFLIAFAVFLPGCNRESAELKQIQQQRSGDYVITLSNQTGLVKRSDHLTLEFRRASTNELADPTNVQIQASMSMPGMGPMFGTLTPPQHQTPGRYEFDADFGMVGRWNVVVTFDSNQRVQFNINAQ